MIEVTCMCGFQARGSEDDVVESIQEHGLADHGSKSERETILEMAAVVPDGPDAGGD